MEFNVVAKTFDDPKSKFARNSFSKIGKDSPAKWKIANRTLFVLGKNDIDMLLCVHYLEHEAGAPACDAASVAFSFDAVCGKHHN